MIAIGFERIWHIEDSQSQVSTLAVRSKILKPFTVFPLRFEAVCAVFGTDGPTSGPHDYRNFALIPLCLSFALCLSSSLSLSRCLSVFACLLSVSISVDGPGTVRLPMVGGEPRNAVPGLVQLRADR